MASPSLTETRIRALLDPRRRRMSASMGMLLACAVSLLICVPLLSLKAVGASLHSHSPRPQKAAALLAAVDTPRRAAHNTPAGSRHGRAAGPAGNLSFAALLPERTLFEPMRLPRPVTVRIVRTAARFARIRTAANLPDLAHAASADSAAPAADAGSLPVAAASDSARPGVEESLQARIAWGPKVDGLRAGLRLPADRSEYAPGEKIWQEVYLRNSSPNPVEIQSIGGYEEQGAPAITDAQGAAVKVLRYFGMGAMFVRTTRIQPGELALVGKYAVTFVPPHDDPDASNEVAPGLSPRADGTAIAQAGPGLYHLKEEITPFSTPTIPWKEPLQTGAIAIRIVGPGAATAPFDRNKIDDISTAPIAWGRPVGGLQAGLITLGSTVRTRSSSRSDFLVGERIRVAVILRNVSVSKISFWHETSFPFLPPPNLREESGKRRVVRLDPEAEWAALNTIRMTGLTYDLSFAPSAGGPSRLRSSEIAPGQAVLGYYLTAFVAPPAWSDGRPTPGRYRLSQPARVGRGREERLDTTLTTGELPILLRDPGLPAN